MDVLQKEYKVKKGEDVTIEVHYTSVPKPNDEWFVSGRLVKKSKRVTTSYVHDFQRWVHERMLVHLTLL
jgi:hypothetical protein